MITQTESKEEIKEVILKWFSLPREGRRDFDWESKPMIYLFLLQRMFEDVKIDQLLIQPEQVNERFNKFFTTVFRFKRISGAEQFTYNLNDFFLFVLDGDLAIEVIPKRPDDPLPQFKQLFSECHRVENNRIDGPQCVKVICSGSQECKYMYADRILVQKFKIELLKDDKEKKIQFLNNFLFCGSAASFPVHCLAVQRHRRGVELNNDENKILIVYWGSVNHIVLDRVTGKKWNFPLVRGAMLETELIKDLICNKSSANSSSPRSQRISNLKHSYTSSQCILIAMPEPDYIRAIRNEAETRKRIIERIRQSENACNLVMERTVIAQQALNEAKQGQLQLIYPIRRNKQSKAFRKKMASEDCNYEEFMTINKYQKMTENKENVEKKHTLYNQLKGLLKERQKQQRIKLKMKSEIGMKEIKKNEYNARLKKAKIQNLAIKDSITNTEKYRERPHEIKFIFQEDCLTGQNKVEIYKKPKLMKRMSMESNQLKGDRNLLKPSSAKINRKLVHRFQSSPNIKTKNPFRPSMCSIANTENN